MFDPWLLFTGTFWLELARHHDAECAALRTLEKLWSRHYAAERDHDELIDLGGEA